MKQHTYQLVTIDMYILIQCSVLLFFSGLDIIVGYVLKSNYFTRTTCQRVRNPARNNPASHASINFFSRHPTMLSS